MNCCDPYPPAIEIAIVVEFTVTKNDGSSYPMERTVFALVPDSCTIEDQRWRFDVPHPAPACFASEETS